MRASTFSCIKPLLKMKKQDIEKSIKHQSTARSEQGVYHHVFLLQGLEVTTGSLSCQHQFGMGHHLILEFAKGD